MFTAQLGCYVLEMLDFLNNASVAAFVGAFCAFLLVAVTDLRRRYKLRKLLRYQVSDCEDHARKKQEAVQMNLALIKKDGRITDAPFMKFPTHGMRDYALQILDLLDANHKQGLDALLYWMEAIDELLREATWRASRIKEFEIQSPDDPNKQIEVSRYIETLEEADRNLEYLADLAGAYVSGRPHNIIEFYHPIGGSQNDRA